MVYITRAGFDDLAEILKLQKAAFLSEAQLLQNFEIQPLKQTLAELQYEFGRMSVLKAVLTEGDGAKIIGSARGYMADGTLYVGKLMEHPQYRCRGVGGFLLNAIEKEFAKASRYELFTSGVSLRNLKLYAKNGYREFKRQASGMGFELVFMEKLKP